MFTSCPAVCSNPFVTFILKGNPMNPTATSESTPVAEVPLTRAAKEKLLLQMYTRKHWIELIRLFAYQTLPMEQARQAIQPLAEQFGKESMATACEMLVEISTSGKETSLASSRMSAAWHFRSLGPSRRQAPSRRPSLARYRRQIHKRNRSNRNGSKRRSRRCRPKHRRRPMGLLSPRNQAIVIR